MKAKGLKRKLNKFLSIALILGIVDLVAGTDQAISQGHVLLRSPVNPPTPDLANWRGPLYNCYNYATDSKSVFFAQPMTPPAGVPPITCANIAAQAIADGLIPAAWPGPPAPPPGCPPGQDVVALAIIPDGSDYHWYRRNMDGSWSQKHGKTPAITTDDAGAPMTDLVNPPHAANRGPYTTFCGYFCVPKTFNLDGVKLSTLMPIPTLIRSWKLRKSGMIDMFKDICDLIGTLVHLPDTTMHVSDPQWSNTEIFRGYALAPGSGVSGFPPYLRVFQGTVAYYYSDTSIVYYADNNGLEAYLDSQFAHQTHYRILSPDNWYDPYVKVTPNSSRTLELRIIYSIGDEPLIWEASADHPCILGAYGGTLNPGDSVTLTFTVSGSGACNGKFICGNVVINTNEGGGTTCNLPVYAVVANDYYECPVDPLTYDTLENSKLRLYTNANCEEWISDISTRPDSVYDVFFEESDFIATTQSTDTIVGRFFSQAITTKEGRTGVRDRLYTCDVEWGAADFWFVYTKDIYIMPPVPACEQINTLRWYWWEESKHIAFFKPTAPDLYQRIVIEYVTVKRKNPPSWWPNQPTFTSYPNTYIGVVSDIDAPFDTGFENGMNKAGYDLVSNIAWQRGFDYTGAHPEYNSYYAAIALANGGRTGESTVPYGAYNVKSHTDLYPNHGWGWKDGRLYRLAADPLPADIVDGPAGPDSAVDRAQVFTARMIPAGNYPNASYSYTVVKTFSKDGETDLKATIDSARAIVNRQRILCGDVKGDDGMIGLGDITYLIAYVYKGGPPPPCPSSRGDVNSSGGLPDLGDLVYLIAYLYKGGPAPVCFAGL